MKVVTWKFYNQLFMPDPGGFLSLSCRCLEDDDLVNDDIVDDDADDDDDEMMLMLLMMMILTTTTMTMNGDGY